MAKILLNVDINKDEALNKLNLLKADFEKIADSLDFSKNAKELTAAIEKLVTVYKDLAEAAKQVSTAAGNTRKHIDDTGDSAEKQSKKLYGLEERLAKLSKSTEDVSGKTKVMGTALKDVGEKTEKAWKTVRAFNETGADMGKTAKEMREETQRLSATTASLQKEYNAAAKAETEATKSKEEHAKALRKAKEQYTSTEKALHDLSRSIKEVESQYPAGTFDALKTSVGNALTQLEGLSTRSRRYISEVANLSGVQKDLAASFSKTRDETEKLDGSVAKAKEQAERLKKAFYDMDNSIKQMEDKYPAGTFNSLRTSIQNALVQLNGLDETSKTYVGDVEKLKSVNLQLGTALSKVKDETDKLDDSYEKAEKQAESLDTKLYNLLKRISNEENRYDNGVFDGLKEKIRGVIEETESLDKTDANYITRVKELQRETDGIVQELSKVEATANHAAPAVSTLGEKFGNLVDRYAKFYASSLLVRKPLELIKNALGEVGETLVKTEDAVIELQRVLDGTIPQSKEISGALYNLAYEYGQTFENASTLAANFARSGKTWTESLEATEAALLAMNVAELNATSASDGLLSIIQQFGMETSELLTIVDKLNKVADKNPVTTGKLLEAIKRSGSAAKNANISFDQTLAIITSISEATNRSGQNIGTAINSLIQYSSKKIDDFRGLSEEANAMVDKFKAGLVSITDVWKQVAQDIHNNKEMRDALIDSLGTDGMEELSSTLHDELEDLVSEIDGVYNVANTYRKNYFVALLDNMFDTEENGETVLGRFSKVLQDLQDVQDYSHKENDRYMETYTAKVNQLQAAWQKLANDEQGILKLKKGIVELGIAIVEFTEQSGGIVSTVMTVVGLLGGLTLIAKAETLTKAVTALGTSIKATLTGAGTALQSVTGAIGLATAALSALLIAFNAYDTAQRRHLEETIETAKAHSDDAKSLKSLYEEYQKLTPESDNYKTVEERILELLGDKAEILDDVTSHTKNYKLAVEALTKAQLEQYEMEMLSAKRAVEKKLTTLPRGIDALKNPEKGKFKGQAAEYAGKNWDDDVSVQELLNYYDELQRRQVNLAAMFRDLTAQGLSDEAEKYFKEWQNNQNLIQSVADDIKEYRDIVHELNGALDALNNPVTPGHIVGRAGVVPNLKNELEAASGAAEDTINSFANLSQQIEKDLETATEYAKALETVSAAQKEYNENGAVSTTTMGKLLELGDEYVKAIFDETGELNLNSDSVKELNEFRQKWLEDNGYIVPGLEKEENAIHGVRIATEEEIKALQLNIGEKEKAIQAAQNQIDIGKKFKENIETVNAAQKELEHTGKLSIETQEKLLGLKKNLVRAMIDENGNIDVNSDQVKKLIKKWEEYCEQLGIAIEDTYKLEKQTDETLSKIQDEISLWKSKLTIEEKDGSSMAQREERMRGIISLLDLEIQKLESTRDLAENKRKVDEEINKLKAEQLDYEAKIQKMYDDAAKEQAKLIEEQQKAAEKAAKEAEQAEKDRLKAIEDAQKAQIAAYDAEINLYNSKISLSEAENGTVEERVGYYEQIKEILQEKIEYLELLGGREAEINELKVDQYEIEEKIAKLKEDEIERLQQEELAVITDEIDLLESRLKIAEQTYGAEAERISILASINALLGQQIQYLISIGATELEINKIKSEQLGIQAQILALEQQSLMLVQNAELGAIQDELDALLNGVEIEEKSLDLTEQQIDLEKDRSAELKKAAELEEQIAKAKLEYIESVIDAYMKSEKSADSLAEKQEAVQNAREKLEQARRDSVAKALEAAYKKQNDSASDALDLEEKRLAVEKARVALTAAENDKTVRVYNEESGEWERQADAKKVQDAKEAFNDAVRALNDFVEEQAWDEVISAVENGSISGSRMNAILDKWAAANYGEGTPEFIAKIKSVYKQSLGHIDEDDSVIGAEKNVEKAVKSLNDYLKSEAINELKEYLEAGNRDTEGMNAILDKWMGLGEGGEMYAWRTGLLDVVTEAIESNYYDDSKIRSSIEDTTTKIKETTTAVHGTTAEVKKLNTTFVTEIRKAAKDSSDAVAAVIAKYQDSVDARFIEWANDVLTTKQEYEEREAYYTEKQSNGLTQAEIDKFTAEMIENSKAWASADEAERKRLEERNLALGSLLGWKRDDDSGVWFNSEGKRAYDNGGVLRGIGGIKATGRPEIVLDPNLTEKILRPNSEAQFRAFADALGLIFEHGDRIGASSKPIINGQRYSDSHNVSTVINGVPIPSHVADNYTIAELARMIPAV